MPHTTKIWGSSMIHVKSSDIIDLCESVDRHLDGIEQVMARLHAHSLTLQSKWSGEAHDAYQRAATAWEESLLAMTKLARQLTFEADAHVTVVGVNDRKRANVWRR